MCTDLKDCSAFAMCLPGSVYDVLAWGADERMSARLTHSLPYDKHVYNRLTEATRDRGKRPDPASDRFESRSGHGYRLDILSLRGRPERWTLTLQTLQRTLQP